MNKSKKMVKEAQMFYDYMEEYDECDGDCCDLMEAARALRRLIKMASDELDDVLDKMEEEIG